MQTIRIPANHFAAFIDRLESEFPPSIRFWEAPNCAPEGYIAIGAHARFFPILDAQGNPTTERMAFLERREGDFVLYHAVKVTEGDHIENVLNSFRKAAHDLMSEDPQKWHGASVVGAHGLAKEQVPS